MSLCHVATYHSTVNDCRGLYPKVQRKCSRESAATAAAAAAAGIALQSPSILQQVFMYKNNFTGNGCVLYEQLAGNAI